MTDTGANGAPDLILVVDDDAGVRDSVATLLSARRRASLTFGCGQALLDWFDAGGDAGAGGCIVMDYFMPGMTGLDTLAHLKTRAVAQPVIIITAHGDVELAVRAMKEGAFDFIEKPWERDALFAAIDRAQARARASSQAQATRRAAQETIASFTPREADVFKELIGGAANKVVARNLDISPRTVEFYRARVLDKSGVESIAGLVRLAFAAGGLEAAMQVEARGEEDADPAAGD